jgi:hypothetical protein
MRDDTEFGIACVALCASIALGTFIGGCTTTTTTTGTGTKAVTVTSRTLSTNAMTVGTAIIKVGVREAARYAASKDLNVIPYLQSVDVALTAALNNGAVNDATLTVVLRSVSVSEVQDNPAVQELISDVLDIVLGAEGQALTQQINKVAWLPPALTAVRDGLRGAGQ